MVRGRQFESVDEGKENMVDEGELLKRRYNYLLEYLLYYITVYLLSKDMSIVQSHSGVLEIRQQIRKC